jgi:aminopyrrolnitrin oxygenase
MSSRTPGQGMDDGVGHAPSRASVLEPPAPASWFLFGESREIGTAPVARTFFGERLVAFRTDTGRAAVLSARCSHMGADLGLGEVRGEHLVCPYHRWAYGTDGRCARIPDSTEIPPFARQRSYPVLERHGYLFFFRGRAATFPLPFFEGLEPEALVAGRAYHFDAECPWHLIAGNAFDLQHLRPVHNRRLLCEPVIDAPCPHSRRIRYESEVLGVTAADRCVRALAGDRVAISIRVWAGNFTLVTARFPRLTSYILVLAAPSAAGHCRVSTLVFRERARNALERGLLQPLSLAVRRTLTGRFLQEDISRLAGIVCDPRRLHPLDHELARFVEWVTLLPRSEAAAHPEPRSDPVPHEESQDPCTHSSPCSPPVA